METAYTFKDSVPSSERAEVMKIIKYSNKGRVLESSLQQYPELREYFVEDTEGKAIKDKMRGIIEMMRGMDFSVKDPEYRAQIMKAVNDYANAKAIAELEKLLNVSAPLPEGVELANGHTLTIGDLFGEQIREAITRLKQ